MSTSSKEQPPSLEAFSVPSQQETVFERRRGVSSVEIRRGYAQVHVTCLPNPLHRSRIEVLTAVEQAGISIDFLKITLVGLAFVVSKDVINELKDTLSHVVRDFSIQGKRSIVLIYAVNMRDEDGLVAKIVARAIEAGLQIDHLGDMHDRLLLVTSDEQADLLAETIRKEMMV